MLTYRFQPSTVTVQSGKTHAKDYSTLGLTHRTSPDTHARVRDLSLSTSSLRGDVTLLGRHQEPVQGLESLGVHGVDVLPSYK